MFLELKWLNFKAIEEEDARVKAVKQQLEFDRKIAEEVKEAEENVEQKEERLEKATKKANKKGKKVSTAIETEGKIRL